MIQRLPVLLLLVMLFSGCLEEECNETITYIGYEPIVLAESEWRNNSFPELASESVCNPGAFYVYGDLLFILDQGEGLHILNNADNANPRPLKFIPIKGGYGLAVRNGILYVNQYIDMLAFDLSDPSSPEFLSRTEDVLVSNEMYGFSTPVDGSVIIGLSETKQTIELDCSSPHSGQGVWLENNMLFFAVNNSGQADFAALESGGAPGTVGTGGSLARFTINQGNLYVVSDYDLRTFSLADATKPTLVSTTQLNWGIETIFPYEDMLYVGSQTGMLIFGLDDPTAPEHLSTLEHARLCDPVVVQNDIAYVTMWGGSECGAQADQLVVVDVSDPRAPREVQTVPMPNSHGLGVDGDKLFLCAGWEGLKVFELDENGRLGNQQYVAGDFNAKDVIVLPAKRELIVLGWEQSGIRQYDYSPTGEPQYAGSINVCETE